MGDFLDSYLNTDSYHLGTIDPLVLNGGSSRETKFERTVPCSRYSERLESAAVLRGDGRKIEVCVEFVAGALAQISITESIFSLLKQVSVFRTEYLHRTKYGLLNENALAATRPDVKGVVALVAPPLGKDELAEFSRESAGLLSNNYRSRYGKELSGWPLYEIIMQLASELVERQQKQNNQT